MFTVLLVSVGLVVPATLVVKDVPLGAVAVPVGFAPVVAPEVTPAGFVALVNDKDGRVPVVVLEVNARDGVAPPRDGFAPPAAGFPAPPEGVAPALGRPLISLVRRSLGRETMIPFSVVA